MYTYRIYLDGGNLVIGTYESNVLKGEAKHLPRGLVAVAGNTNTTITLNRVVNNLPTLANIEHPDLRDSNGNVWGANRTAVIAAINSFIQSTGGGNVISVNGQTGTVSLGLQNLVNVTTITPTQGDVLSYNSSGNWVLNSGLQYLLSKVKSATATQTSLEVDNDYKINIDATQGKTTIVHAGSSVATFGAQKALLPGVTVGTTGNTYDLPAARGTTTGQVPVFNASNNTTSFQAVKVADLSGSTDDLAQGATNLFFTSAEQSKLAGIQSGAEVNVNADWNSSSGDSQILNKPTLSTVATSGSYNDLSNLPSIPAAYTDSDVDNHLNTATATTGQILSWTGSDYDWVLDAAGAPAGTVGQLQYNNSGIFGASSNLFWDISNNRLGIGTSSPTRSLSVTGDASFGQAFITASGPAQLHLGLGNSTSAKISTERGVINIVGNTISDGSGGTNFFIINPMRANGAVFSAATTEINSDNLTLYYQSSNPDSNYIGAIRRQASGWFATNPHKMIGIGDSDYFNASAGTVLWYTNNQTYYKGLLLDKTGNVGIGTITPTDKLQANGSILSGVYGFVTPVAGKIRSVSPNTSYGEIGFSSQYNNLASGLRSYGVSDTTYARDLRFYVNDDTADSGDGDERMRITHTGNVGIGTTTPANKLQVAGDIGFTDGATRYIKLANRTVTGGGNHIIIEASNANTNGTGGNIYLYEGTGAGGPGPGTIFIGKSGGGNPSCSVNGRLDVSSSGPNVGTALRVNAGGIQSFAVSWDNINGFRGYGLGTVQSRFLNSTSYTFDNNLLIGTNTNSTYKLDVNGSARIQTDLTVSGNVGIGTTTPTVKLQVEGGIRFASDGAGSNYMEISRLSNNQWSWTTSGVGEIMRQSGNITTWKQDLTVERGGLRVAPTLSNPQTAIKVDHTWNDVTKSFATIDIDVIDTTSASDSSFINIAKDGATGFIVNKNFNVGIGTTTPSEKLSVSGSAEWFDGTTTNGYVNKSKVSQNGISFTRGVDGSYSAGLFVSDTLNSRQTAIIRGREGAQLNYDTSARLRAFSAGISIGLFTGNSANAANNALTVHGNTDFTGNVGIGITTPSEKLHVVGKAILDDGTNKTYFSVSNSNILIGKDQTGTPVGIKIGTGTLPESSGGISIGNGSLQTGVEGSIAIGNTARANRYSVSIGDGAARFTTSTHNVQIGFGAGSYNGIYGISIGMQANGFSTGSQRHVAIGGLIGSSGAMNFSVGIGAEAMIYGGANSVGIGYNALKGSVASTFSNTVAIGYQALTALTTGTGNVAIGYQASKSLTTSIETTNIGYQAGLSGSSDASYNVFIGYQSGMSGSSVTSNTMVGHKSGATNSTGDNNTSLGAGSSLYLLSGNGNVAIGSGAMLSNSTGSDNVMIGHQSGRNAIGSANVFIGHDSGYNETGSNKLYIENSNSATPLIYGEFDTDLIRINGSFEVTSTTTSAGLYASNQTELRLYELTANGTNYIALKAAGTLAGDTTYTLPTADGSAGQTLTTDASGNMSWAYPKSPVKSEAGTAYTLVLADAGKYIRMTATTAITITIPQDIFAVGDEFFFEQNNTGQVTVAAGTGVTLRNTAAFLAKTAERYAIIGLKCVASNEFILTGERELV